MLLRREAQRMSETEEEDRNHGRQVLEMIAGGMLTWGGGQRGCSAIQHPGRTRQDTILLTLKNPNQQLNIREVKTFGAPERDGILRLRNPHVWVSVRTGRALGRCRFRLGNT